MVISRELVDYLRMRVAIGRRSRYACQSFQFFHSLRTAQSSQVKFLITTYAFCTVQRATAQSEIGNIRDFGIAEALPGFKAGWSGSACSCVKTAHPSSLNVCTVLFPF
jgi:hypothetical protein